MIHNYKAPPTKWWPVISKLIDASFYLFVGINVFLCIFRHEWAAATTWAVLYCMGQLRDIKDKL